jgi:uronate dehydrogenase
MFGEGIARLYWDRWGIETVCLRIGTATPAPQTAAAWPPGSACGDLACAW